MIPSFEDGELFTIFCGSKPTFSLPGMLDRECGRIIMNLSSPRILFTAGGWSWVETRPGVAVPGAAAAVAGLRARPGPPRCPQEALACLCLAAFRTGSLPPQNPRPPARIAAPFCPGESKGGDNCRPPRWSTPPGRPAWASRTPLTPEPDRDSSVKLHK